MRTIDGNKSNAVKEMVTSVTQAHGFVEIDGTRPFVAVDEPPVEDVSVLNGNESHDGDNDTDPRWPNCVPIDWTPARPHSVIGCSRQWCADETGIYIVGKAGPLRTKGKPITAGRVWTRYGLEIAEAAALFALPKALILGMLITESGLLERPERQEKALRDWSIGVAQTLTSTAYHVAKRLDIEPPDKPLPMGGDIGKWREWLHKPRNSILCGAAYLAHTNRAVRPAIRSGTLLRRLQRWLDAS